MIQLKLSTCNKNGSHNTNGVKPYYGLDDEHRSFLDWHRELGPSLPMVDIDCLLIEFNHCKPVAIIELKSSYWLPNLNGACIRTLQNLGNMSSLPVFVVRCSHDHQSFTVYPLNRLGTAIIDKPTIMSRDGSYEAFLHDLRKKARCR